MELRQRKVSCGNRTIYLMVDDRNYIYERDMQGFQVGEQYFRFYLGYRKTDRMTSEHFIEETKVDVDVYGHLSDERMQELEDFLDTILELKAFAKKHKNKEIIAIYDGSRFYENTFYNLSEIEDWKERILVKDSSPFGLNIAHNLPIVTFIFLLVAYIAGAKLLPTSIFFLPVIYSFIVSAIDGVTHKNRINTVISTVGASLLFFLLSLMFVFGMHPPEWQPNKLELDYFTLYSATLFQIIVLLCSPKVYVNANGKARKISVL